MVHYVTTMKVFAVVCCDSEGTDGIKLENISLMFSSSEIVSWKTSFQLDFDLLSLRNFVLYQYLSRSLAGKLCVCVNVIMIPARN